VKKAKSEGKVKNLKKHVVCWKSEKAKHQVKKANSTLYHLKII